MNRSGKQVLSRKTVFRLFFLFLVCTGILSGAEPTTTVAEGSLAALISIDKCGVLRLEKDIKAIITQFDMSWSTHSQYRLILAPDYPKVSKERFETAGRMPAGDEEFQLLEQVHKSGRSTFHYCAQLKADKQVPSKAIVLAFTLPGGGASSLTVDGKDITLPLNTDRKVLHNAKASRVVLHLSQREVAITGTFQAFLQGGFEYGVYSLRLSPESALQASSGWQWQLDLDFSIQEHRANNNEGKLE